MLVIAGAGTGKTAVLTKRIARLVGEGHARPDEVLAVTYTKNAAQEMRQRVREELRGTDLSALRIATFHEYCNDLLRENNRPFDVVDDQVAADGTELRRLPVGLAVRAHRAHAGRVEDVAVVVVSAHVEADDLFG